jgi:hypothetical protein
MPTRVHDRRRQGQDEVRTLVPTRVDNRGRHEQRSMRLNDVFDNFRREVEGATNPCVRVQTCPNFMPLNSCIEVYT